MNDLRAYDRYIRLRLSFLVLFSIAYSVLLEYVENDLPSVYWPYMQVASILPLMTAWFLTKRAVMDKLRWTIAKVGEIREPQRIHEVLFASTKRYDQVYHVISPAVEALIVPAASLKPSVLSDEDLVFLRKMLEAYLDKDLQRMMRIRYTLCSWDECVPSNGAVENILDALVVIGTPAAYRIVKHFAETVKNSGMREHSQNCMKAFRIYFETG